MKQLIIKNIFHKLYIHPFFYFFTIIFLITGQIYKYLIFVLIIFVHELGHTLMALLLKWKIDNISIYPYGGISKFSTMINVANYQELLVLLSGPIVQILFMLLFQNFIDIKYKSIFVFYNFFILVFNFLPIYPLDGGKLVKIISSYFISFKKSFLITFIISAIFIGIILGISVIYKYYFLSLIIFIIFLKLIDEDILIIYNKFLLERYLYYFNYKRLINISDINDLKKDKLHLINGIDEKKVLINYFENN